MHQYTAHLANRMADDGQEVSLVTTSEYPQDRYSPQIHVQIANDNKDTGISIDSLRIDKLGQTLRKIIGQEPDVVHFTGPHLWNPFLIKRLKRHGLRTQLVAIHDLDPHEGQRFGKLLRLWNETVIRTADMILVHGQCYRQALIDSGVAGQKIWMTPLLHLFLSYERTKALNDGGESMKVNGADNYVLFFGRLEAYKGLDMLLSAYDRLERADDLYLTFDCRWNGQLMPWSTALPKKVVLRNWRIGDDEAIDLFQNASLIVLPYTSATQSALIAAAYFFKKPVLVTDSGALAEYVKPELTGFVIKPQDEDGLVRALAEAASNPQRLKKMGVSGLDWYDQARENELLTLKKLYKEAINRII